MRTLVEKVISTYGDQEDEFFSPDDVIEFLNGGYSRTVSVLAQMERDTDVTLRSLDDLRLRNVIDVVEPVVEENGNQVTEIDLPDTILDIVHSAFIDVSRSETITLRELKSKQLILIDLGTAIPNWMEYFYHIASNSQQKTMQIFGKEISTNEDQVRLYYIVKPTPITDTDTDLPDLPKHLERAVIYASCKKMALKDQNGDLAGAYENSFLSEIRDNGL